MPTSLLTIWILYSLRHFADDMKLGGAATTLKVAIQRSFLDRLEKQTNKNLTKFFQDKYKVPPHLA